MGILQHLHAIGPKASKEDEHKKRGKGQIQHQGTDIVKKRPASRQQENRKISKCIFFILIVLLFSNDAMTIDKDNKTTIDKYNDLQAHNTTTTTLILTNRPKTYNTRKKLNKLQHSLNGNHYLNIAHWNKGNTLFKNKTPQIDQILNTHKPHILSLCEANIEKMINDTPNDQYFDYKIKHTKIQK